MKFRVDCTLFIITSFTHWMNQHMNDWGLGRGPAKVSWIFLNLFSIHSSLQIYDICTRQIQHRDWFLWFVFPVAVSSPFYHSHSYLRFSLQLLLAFVVGISITKMHANTRFLNGNGMKTRPSSIPKHPAQVQWTSGSQLQLVIHVHVERQDERVRWRHLWRQEL